VPISLIPIMKEKLQELKQQQVQQWVLSR
jgi:hypothetical protein